MKKINISAIPTQSFTVNEGDHSYAFTFRCNDGFMTYDISVDSESIISGFRFVAGQMLIPYKYLEVDGNFILGMAADEDIDYTKFGDTQNLYYLTADESESFASVD